MSIRIKNIFCFFLVLFLMNAVHAQRRTSFPEMENAFQHPPASAKPWVFWYWINGNVSKEGITADLEAMKQVGLGGAYLMFIKDTLNPSAYSPAVRQLSSDWFKLVAFAIEESKRLHLELGFHVSDGFALAGGPWISPAMSMQKIVWSKLKLTGGRKLSDSLPQPSMNEGYYKDIAIYAYPTANPSTSTLQIRPTVSTSTGINANFLLLENSKESFKSDTAAWILYQFEQPFTCRTITIRTNGNNYQSHRLIVQCSLDGIHYKTITRLDAPRHGWQDTDSDVTHAIPTTTAKYFRFVYDKTGTEPGSEDLDNAKWKPTLKVSGIELSSEAKIHQFESKNGEIWRISPRTDTSQITDQDCIPLNKIINLSANYQNGKLNWEAPDGNWTILRIGHTSTGHRNETAGGAKGLECDKFSEQAIRLQFNQWFAKIYGSVNEATAREVIKVFHIDSWECGSQNWSENFALEFKKRRGYDLMPYIAVMTGVPIFSVSKSEAVLYDVRKTIAELVAETFYGTLKKLAAEKHCIVSAESVAPTMMSDGLLHYKYADLPMGEFWNNSPTHDKPNDMLDAISAAHIYGKNIIQAESFTTLRMDWNESPGTLKALGDRNFALGINRMVIHVFAHNPWINKQPGVTLDPIGLYFQRNQTWFAQSNAWINYLSRTQFLLQQGKPVADLAVFTGEELPRRAVLPERLLPTLPGIYGIEKQATEHKRLLNTNQPMRQIPAGISHSANMADPENFTNPLNGYAYDSFNPDALMGMHYADGLIETASGSNYKILVLPAFTKMNPNNILSKESAKKILAIAKAGGLILMDPIYLSAFGNTELHFQTTASSIQFSNIGKGKIILSPYQANSFQEFGIEKDIQILNEQIVPSSISYTHRTLEGAELYFISNQLAKTISLNLSFRTKGEQVELWDANAANISVHKARLSNGRTLVDLTLAPNASKFILIKNSKDKHLSIKEENKKSPIIDHIPTAWKLKFDSTKAGPEEIIMLDSLDDLTKQSDPKIKYYSGKVIYQNKFELTDLKNVFLSFKDIRNIATVTINGINCGTIWTPPFELDISKAVKKGMNEVQIEVTNTWNNRLILDSQLPAAKRITYTVYPFDWSKKMLQPSGIIGAVQIIHK